MSGAYAILKVYRSPIGEGDTYTYDFLTIDSGICLVDWTEKEEDRKKFPTFEETKRVLRFLKGIFDDNGKDVICCVYIPEGEMGARAFVNLWLGINSERRDFLLPAMAISAFVNGNEETRAKIDKLQEEMTSP